MNALAGLTLVLLIALRGVSAADPMTDKKPPGSVKVFAEALAHFDLEIPIAEKNSVVAIKTLTSDPRASFQRDPGYGHFCWAAGGTQLVMQTPPNGATTPNSHFPRTELIQKKTERWMISSGDHALTGIFAVTSVPKVTDKGEITLAQIHDNVSDHGPLLKVICDYKSKPWKLMAEYRIEPMKSSKIIRTPEHQRLSIAASAGVEFAITLSSVNVLTVKARKFGAQTWTTLSDSMQRGQALDKSWADETCYFKAGCYMFDPSDAATPVGEIRFAKLELE